MSQAIKTLTILIALIMNACANDAALIQVKGDVTDDEIAVLQKASDKWCEAGFDCIKLTRDSAPDTLVIVSEVKCSDYKAKGCTTLKTTRIDQTLHIQIKDKSEALSQRDWNTYLESVALHEFGHYLTNAARIPHIKESGYVMSNGDEKLPTTLTDKDVEWAEQVFAGRGE